MTDRRRLELLAKERDRLRKGYGHKAAYFGNEVVYDTNAISTGWLGLDFILGTGGVPRSHQVEFFGVNDIGKSSLVANGIIKSAQKEGLLVGYVALEPSFDPGWVERNGVDLERVLIAYPDNGFEGFEILHDWATGKDYGGNPVLDYIIFDSIGAAGRAEESEKGTPSAYGASNLITAATRSLLMPCFKNNIGIAYLNQVRVQSTPGGGMGTFFESPGGEGLKHHCMQRVQLSPGGDRHYAGTGEKQVQIGHSVIARIKRNKLAEGSGQKAKCDYYTKETDEHELGIDWAKDVLETSLSVGVIKGSGWYEHPSFPTTNKGEHKVQGRPGIEKFFLENPEALERIRGEVLQVMAERVAEAKRKKEVRLNLKQDPEAVVSG